MNRLKKLQEFGQSVYMDEIRRSMLTDGTLKTLIERDGLRGVTSNPAIFQKAIAESNDYDETIALMQREGQGVEQIYEELVVADIEAAADLLRPVYEESDGRFGFVSLEVNPHLAFDTEGTIKEARHLWEELARPNVFIKVPGTQAGLPAIRRLTAEGVNVNVTLLFGIERYRQVALAYIAGLEDRLEAGHDIHRVASVASFFLSRIDVMVDPLLEASERQGGELAGKAANLKGKVAIANAKLAYRAYREIFEDDRFQRLAGRGARTQRVLWASTSTKNPAYSDTMYVEPLIGPDTVNTMPVETLDAYRDHGEPASRLEQGVDEAAAQLRLLGELGIDLDGVTEKLEREGIDKFVKPFDSLMETLRKAAGATA
jgi:transaldolase